MAVLIPTQLERFAKPIHSATRNQKPTSSRSKQRTNKTTTASSSADNNNASESPSKNSYPRVGLQFGILSSCRLW
eukprot:scaffold6954_cov201-Skeletonema_dohrnii-CCMP3373.AAC.6